MIPVLFFDEWVAVSEGQNFVEFHWIGIDNLGRIGIFSSVSTGYIPLKVFNSYESYLVLHTFLCDLQPFTTAKIVAKESGSHTDWRDWAQKGLIAYDYADLHRKVKSDRYDLIAIPGKPLLIVDFPELDIVRDIIPRFNLVFTGDISFTQLQAAEY